MQDIIDRLVRFTEERDWQQFHTPKNLAMALSVESAELLELFQWLSAEESQNPDDERRGKIADELADVFVYCLLLSPTFGM